MDLNGDGKIDDFEKKHAKIHYGRSFFMTIFVILSMIVLAILNRGDQVFFPLCTALGLYLGRSVGNDFANINRRDK